jgi:hypothetical protein
MDWIRINDAGEVVERKDLMKVWRRLRDLTHPKMGGQLPEKMAK